MSVISKFVAINKNILYTRRTLKILLMPYEITNFEVFDLKEPSRYLKPFRMRYEQNGHSCTWDGITSHDSVSVLIYNQDEKVFVFVKQFRPVVYFTKIQKFGSISNNKLSSSKLGETLELCAGLIDHDHGESDLTAKQEIYEECGYNIDKNSLKIIKTFCTNIGFMASEMTIYYTEVTNSQKVIGAGGGLPGEGEFIKVIEWPISKLDDLLGKETELTVTMPIYYALYWFKENILPTIDQKFRV